MRILYVLPPKEAKALSCPSYAYVENPSLLFPSFGVSFLSPSAVQHEDMGELSALRPMYRAQEHTVANRLLTPQLLERTMKAL